jgi:hypothetical protein
MKPQHCFGLPGTAHQLPLLLLYYCCRCLRCVLLPASLLRLLLLWRNKATSVHPP